MKWLVAASLPVLSLLGVPVPAEGAEPAKLTVAAVLAEFDRMTALPLWPGFDAKRIPLAIYDGGGGVTAKLKGATAEKDGSVLRVKLP